MKLLSKIIINKDNNNKSLLMINYSSLLVNI